MISGVDPEFISEQALTDLAPPLNNALNEFRSFAQDTNNESALQHALTNFEGVLYHLSKLFVFYQKTTRSKEALSEILAEYKKETNEGIESLKEKVEEVEAQIEGEDGLDEKIEATGEELETLNQVIQTAQKSHETEFKNWFDGTKTKADERVGKFYKKLESDAETKLGELNVLLEKAEKVYGAVQTTCQAGAHANDAKQQQRAANLYRWGFIIVFILLFSIIALWELIHSAQEKYVFDIWRIAGRVALSSPLVVLGFYLARESSKHRHREFTNRDKGLILETIDPYLELINDQDKKELLKIEIANRTFTLESADNKEEGATPNFFDSIIRKQIENKMDEAE